MNKTTIILISLFSMASLFASGQAPDKEYKTFNKEISLGIGEDSIAVYAMIAAGADKKETVIFLHGIAGNERNLDIAQDLRASGINSIYFNYRGSWGSQGEYLYSNCLEDVGHLLSFLSDSTTANELRIDTNQFSVIGHSLGGGVALITGASDSRIKKIIAISSFNIGAYVRENDTKDSLMRFQDGLRRNFMLNSHPEKFVQELINNRKDFNVLSHANELNEKNVIMIDDYDRTERWPGELKTVLEYHVIESDHSFTNKRDELSMFILDWLNSN